MTTSTVPTPGAGAAATSRTGLVMSGVSLELGDGDRLGAREQFDELPDDELR